MAQALRPEQLERLPDGTELVSISGRTATVGRDPIDTDSRGGYLAWGPIYQQGITEQLVAVETPVALDPALEYAFEIAVTAPADDAVASLVTAGWLLDQSPEKTVLRRVATPSRVERELAPLPIALRLGHQLRASVATPDGVAECHLYQGGRLGAVRFVGGDRGIR